MLQVFVVEPQPRIANVLMGERAVRIVGVAASTRTVLYRAVNCDLLLVSARLPEAEVMTFIQQQHLTRPVVVIDADETGDGVVPFLESGASGYVPQDANASDIVTTLNAIHAGKPPLAPVIGTALVARMHELLALQQQRAGETLLQNCPDLNTLTGREREILLLIRNGASNQDIANQLMIELGTVKNHVHNILKKLNVSRRAQAASYVDLLEQVM